MPKIPQITGVLNNLVAIFALAIAGGIVNASAHGELQHWTMLWEVFKDSALYGIVAVCAWIGFKSPLAKSLISQGELQNLVDQSKAQNSPVTKQAVALAAEVAKQEVQLAESHNVEINVKSSTEK